MRSALAAALVGALLVPGTLLADDAVPVAPEPVPSTAPAAAPPGDGAAAAEHPPEDANAAVPAPAEPTPTPPAAAKKPAPVREKRKPAKAHAAAAGSVTIRDFAFAPRTIDVKAGDTVTWTNRDSAAHTATAGNGSFNTGTLKKGQSASHTFAKPGRFAYICAIHPNMHGTVVVAGTPVSASAPSSGAKPAAQSAAAPAQNQPTLPKTGLQLTVVALLGACFLACGAVLRALARRPRRRV